MMQVKQKLNPQQQVYIASITVMFIELGYRRATTAELAQRFGVQETILYRIWPSKKAMFLAAIELVYQQTTQGWKDLDRDSEGPLIEQILENQARHHGESGLYKIVFAGLSETDDPEIYRALRKMYKKFHVFLCEQISDYRADSRGRSRMDLDELIAWAMVGLGAVVDIGQELRLISQKNKQRLIQQVGQRLLNSQ